MRSELQGLVSFSISVFTMWQSAHAAQPIHAYKAVYEEKSNSGVALRTQYYDGKGRGRVEVERGGNQSYGVADLDQHKLFMHDPRLGGSAMEMPLDREMENALAGLGDACRKASRPLGKKVIDGHPCTGIHYEMDGYSVDYWEGDDIGIRVMSVCNHPAMGTTVTKLRAYSSEAPSPSLFQLK